MPTTTLDRRPSDHPVGTPTTAGSDPGAAAPPMNNRSVYTAWGLAWLFGYGTYAISGGTDPVLSLPSLVPVAALVTGLVAAFVVTIIATARAARGVTGPAALRGRLVGGAWAVGFTALFLLITALGRTLGDHHVETLMWPAGSAFVVGLLYLMGGAVHRDITQYVLGTYLALVATAAVFLDTPGLYWVLATAGVGGYAVAAAVEYRRHRAQP